MQAEGYVVHKGRNCVLRAMEKPMRKLMSTLAIAALFAGMSASAHATEGWYVRGDVGYSVDGQVDAEFNDGEENFSATADLDNDWMAAGGVGYAYANSASVRKPLP